MGFKNVICACSLGLEICVFTFKMDFELGLTSTATNMSKLKFEIMHFFVILVLLLLNVGGCGGRPLSSKSILKVKTQISKPKEHAQITFLTPWIVFCLK